MLNPARLVTLPGLAALYVDAAGESLFPEATLRAWVHENARGFRDRCVVVPVGKVMVDLDAFALWLEDGRGAVRERREQPQVDAAPRATGPRRLRPFDEVLAQSRRRAG